MNRVKGVTGPLTNTELQIDPGTEPCTYNAHRRTSQLSHNIKGGKDVTKDSKVKLS